ncbi:DNA replication complex GINS protein SLD5 [Penicillium cataractarum]|uniref:DNA replication complex GINS protein SLD5 n=1 Tax=Penicillium cataractarum TaxID=2100454 RepID=A0A9W9S3C5_9EURO|nr:DNA replication complex GINS protein SLD5 [Penicillium cataractarum]KAJ5369859.1 DNA replication complex GINS protein SLD5 [Penicillium cataractarum]
MDIDDILASVDRGPGASPESAALDHQQLTRFWVAERAVSEVLPWPAPLMERVMDRVRIQIETIEDLAASSADTITNTTHNPNLNLRLSILQTDLARTQYIIRSLLRARLAKLTKYSMHYLVQLASRNKNPLSTASQSQSQSQSSSANPNTTPEDSVPDISALVDTAPLSGPETSFVHAHQTLLAGHYGGSFLGAFPRQLRRLDDNAGGTSMVQGPETKEVVFVRCLGAEVPVLVDGEEGVEEVGVVMRMGDVWVVRWEGVRRAWERGEVELL